MVTEDCFEVVERPVPELGPGEALLAVQYVGIDPTIRGWLDERGNYMAGVAIGEPIRSNGVGVVIETNDPSEVSRSVAPSWRMVGWQQYRVLAADEFLPVTIVDEDVELLDTLNVLGSRRAHRVPRCHSRSPSREPGETFLVSAAASGVGSIAGQIAKLRGATVIGIAGGPTKCAWVVDELGFDACIDYKSRRRRGPAQGARAAGRRTSSSTTSAASCSTPCCAASPTAAASCCAATSRPTTSTARRRRCTTSSTSWANGRAWRASTPSTTGTPTRQAPRSSPAWVADGSIKHREHVFDGIDRAPEALVRLFTGDHLGKLAIKVD